MQRNVCAAVPPRYVDLHDGLSGRHGVARVVRACPGVRAVVVRREVGLGCIGCRGQDSYLSKMHVRQASAVSKAKTYGALQREHRHGCGQGYAVLAALPLYANVSIFNVPSDERESHCPCGWSVLSANVCRAACASFGAN